MAITNRDITNMIPYSVQGGQYASADYINLLEEHSISIGMSAKDYLHDNTLMESFFKTSKQEGVYL